MRVLQLRKRNPLEDDSVPAGPIPAGRCDQEAQKHDCVVLARNIADFDLFQQIVPDGRAHYRV